MSMFAETLSELFQVISREIPAFRSVLLLLFYPPPLLTFFSLQRHFGLLILKALIALEGGDDALGRQRIASENEDNGTYYVTKTTSTQLLSLFAAI